MKEYYYIFGEIIITEDQEMTPFGSYATVITAEIKNIRAGLIFTEEEAKIQSIQWNCDYLNKDTFKGKIIFI